MVRSQLDEKKFERLFIANLEKERVSLGFSQRDMAQWLNMSLSTYKRVVNGETGVKGLYTLAVLYYLTGKLCFEFVEVHDERLDAMVDLKNLPQGDFETVVALINHLKSK